MQTHDVMIVPEKKRLRLIFFFFFFFAVMLCLNVMRNIMQETQSRLRFSCMFVIHTGERHVKISFKLVRNLTRNTAFLLYWYSAAAKIYFFKWVQPAVRHRLTYIKMLVLTSSLRKPMLTTWHFSAGGDILGQKHVF